LAQYSGNLVFNNYRAVPNRVRNHYFGGGDDGLQLSNCKGFVTIKNCEFGGLMDDPINIHGTSVQIQEIMSETELKCKFMHHQSVGLPWGRKNDLVSFIENDKMNTLGTATIDEFISEDPVEFIVRFKDAVPANLEPGDALENLTWVPDVHIHHSHFKNGRARGLLVSTPGEVIIENNIFESSGSAILISGDANFWFESGAVKNVQIKNNTFTDLCNTSSYQFCEGVISIYPIIPDMEENTPPFHKNITIEGNRFEVFDYPVLFARSVNGLHFKNNTLVRSYRFEPYHSRQYTFSFEGCTNIEIKQNSFDENLLGKNILLKWTNKNELLLDTDIPLEISSF
jgi:hypothetical protein